MIKITFLALLLASTVYAVDTHTSTTFGNPISAGTDKYGNNIYKQSVTIQTDNFKVDNFWKKFSLSGNGTDNTSFSSISKSGNVLVTVETTSACTLDNSLANEGCSGQKPFLLNNEVLNNQISGTTDEYEVAFIESPNFSNSDQFGFYPLDILRDEKYYKDTIGGGSSSSGGGFFGFITGAFDFIFSKTIGFGNDFFGKADIADVESNGRSDAAEDRRQRYIANIIAGIEKNQRMTKAVNGATATQINAPTLNTPASLLHYTEAKKTTTTDQCRFMFINLSSKGVMCRMMGGFGMDAWMPFFNKTKTTEIEANYIMADTENSLLAMTGKIENVPYMQDVGGSEDGKLSFLQNMLKPMTTMFGFMKTMMFGSSKASIVSDPVERVYAFSEDEAMTMTFAITDDGSIVNEFANFKLLKIRSVYGDSINSCTVKKNWSFMGGMGWSPEQFFAGDTTSYHGKTGDEWVTWCQESSDSKGMFDYLFDWSSGGPFNPMSWMRGFFAAFMNMFFGSYEIEDITSSVSRGLILNIKKVNVDPLSKRNTQTFKLLSTD